MQKDRQLSVGELARSVELIALQRGITYTIYDTSTGEIIRSGQAGSPKALNNKVGEGQAILFDVKLSGKTHIVDVNTGKAIERHT